MAVAAAGGSAGKEQASRAEWVHRNRKGKRKTKGKTKLNKQINNKIK